MQRRAAAALAPALRFALQVNPETRYVTGVQQRPLAVRAALLPVGLNGSELGCGDTGGRDTAKLPVNTFARSVVCFCNPSENTLECGGQLAALLLDLGQTKLYDIFAAPTEDSDAGNVACRIL